MLFGWVTQVALSHGIHLAVAGSARPTLSFLGPSPAPRFYPRRKRKKKLLLIRRTKGTSQPLELLGRRRPVARCFRGLQDEDGGVAGAENVRGEVVLGATLEIHVVCHPDSQLPKQVKTPPNPSKTAKSENRSKTNEKNRMKTKLGEINEKF